MPVSIAPRRPLEIRGNWGMNPSTIEQAAVLTEEIAVGCCDAFRELRRPQEGRINVGLFAPLGFIRDIGEIAQRHKLQNAQVDIHPFTLQIGAQNMYWEDPRAVTGEHSPAMIHSILRKVGQRPSVLLGHSDRRQCFDETSATVNRRIHAAYGSGVRPFMAIGESSRERYQRTQSETGDALADRLRFGLLKVSAEAFLSAGTVIAYQPVWAIDTDETETPEQVNVVHAHIRNVLAALFDQLTADRTSIIYGGSMQPENAEEFLRQPHIDGALIGPASLNAGSFLGIVQAAISVFAAARS